MAGPTHTARPALSRANFKHVAALVMREAAITLEAGREVLVEERLAPIAARHGLADVNTLVERLRAAGPGATPLHLEVVDALTTNETQFFRDGHPWEALRDHVLPRLIEARAGRRALTVWSAACSTGQEPFSLAMLLEEAFPELRSWAVRIIASDLSPRVLARAASGAYHEHEVTRGLDEARRARHLRYDGRHWVVNEALRARVELRPLNLLRRWTDLPACDLVLMRNVMIYFDAPIRRSILRQVRQVLAPDGFLLLGTAETAINPDQAFRAVTFGPTTFFQAGA